MASVCLLSGCGAAEEKSTVLSDKSTQVGPQDCSVKPNDNFEEAARSEQAAATRIADLGSQHAGHFAGVSVCLSTNSVNVYRKAGDGAFDRAATELAKEEGTRAVLLDAPYSKAELSETALKVQAMRSELSAAGSELLHTLLVTSGYVEVGVSGDQESARLILKDLGDRVRVVTGKRDIP